MSWLKDSWPIFAVLAVAYAVAIPTGSLIPYAVSLGFSAGHCIGAVRSFRRGMTVREEIISEVYGPEWSMDAILGARVRRTGLN